MIKFVFFTCEVDLLCIVYKLALFIGLFGKGGSVMYNVSDGHGVYFDDVGYLNRRDYLFQSLQSVMNYLHKPENYNYPEVQDLIYLFNRFCLRSSEMRMSDFDLSVHPFIVIEGTQASGRETLSKMLSRTFSAWQVTIPPHCLAPVHHTFMHIEKKRPDFKEAYLALCNYAVTNAAKFITRNRPVVVTRYYYNYVSMTLAHRVMRGKPLPDRYSFNYEWPRDLLEPSFTFFLKTNATDDPSRAHTASTIINTFIKVYNMLQKRDSTLKVITLQDYHNTYLQMKQTLQDVLGDRLTVYRSQVLSKKKSQTVNVKRNDKSSSESHSEGSSDDDDESESESNDDSNDKSDENGEESSEEGDDK